MTTANTLKKFEGSVRGKGGVAYDYLDRVDSAGDFSRIEGINVIINSLRNLLITPLESYPFNPEYGSKLYKKVWEPLDQQSQEDIEYEVKDRVALHDSRIRVTSVLISPLSDNKGVTVTVFIKKGDESGEVTLDFSNLPTFGLE